MPPLGGYEHPTDEIEINAGRPVTRGLQHGVRDQGDRLGIVEPDAALTPPSRHVGGHVEQQLVDLAGRELHGLAAIVPALTDPASVRTARPAATFVRSVRPRPVE